MTDIARAYREGRTRVAGLVGDLDGSRLDAPVPATPEWRVRDVLAHLSGVAADITSGNLGGVATDAWTATQVDARRDWEVTRLLDEWDENGSQVERMAEDFGQAAKQLLADTATHEHDIRGALGMPGARDSDALALGFEWMGRSLLPPLRLETDAGTFTTGDGEPVATVRATRFELFRAMTGRRSRDQLLAFGWDGDPRLEGLLLVAIFTHRATPLVE